MYMYNITHKISGCTPPQCFAALPSNNDWWNLLSFEQVDRDMGVAHDKISWDHAYAYMCVCVCV